MRCRAGGILFFGIVLSCWFGRAAGDSKNWKPDIPKVWDGAALADWATPVAGLNVRPTHIPAKEYYSLTIENLRTYPVYFPGREPEGYWEMLQHIGPKPLIEPHRGFEISLLEDVLDAFETGGERLEIFRRPDGGERG